MPKTPLPDHDTPPDPRTELLADLDARIGEPSRPDAPGSPVAAGDGSGGSGGLFVRPEQVDLVLRLHQIGAAWRERVGNDTGVVPTRIDRFEIVEEVGQGGFATVYEATDTLLGRRVALKVAHPEAVVSPGLRRRFLREAELASKISHPNLVTIHDIGESDGVTFIAEEFCNGGTLGAWLDRHPGPVPPRLAAAIVQALAEGLDAAHEQAIVHRDIKPSNVLLTRSFDGGVVPEDGRSDRGAAESGWDVKLGDFGLGKLDAETSSDPLSRLTRVGATLGTPAWMAPEQIDRTIGPVGPATDVHALGLLLDRLLVGTCRWMGDTDSETMRRILLREPEAIDRSVAGVPLDLLAVCRKCLERDPGERYARGGEVAADLSRFLLGVPTQARPLSTWERACRYAIHRPAVVAATAVALLATLACGIALWGWSIQSSAAARERDSMRRIDATLQLQRGLDDLRVGNVGAARERFAASLALDPALDASFAGRWWRRRLRCEREILLGDPDAPAAPEGAPRDLLCIAVSPDGGRIAVGAADGRLILRAATGADTPVVVAGAHDEINDVAFSPDGRLVATAGQDGRVCLWESATGAPYREVAAESKPLFAVCWSPDGTRLAWGGEERILCVGDPDGGAARRIAVPLALDEGGSGGDIEAALFADQASIVVAGGHQILILGAVDGRVIREFTKHEGSVGTIDIAPDGTRLLSGGTDRIPRVWDLATGELLLELPRHPEWVQGCVFTADGKRIVTGCRDSVLQVFDAASGAVLHRLTGHAGRVWDLRREPGGTVLSVGADGTLRRWHPWQSDALAGVQETAIALDSVFRLLPLPGPDPSTRADASSAPGVVIVPKRGEPIVVDGGDGRTRRTLRATLDGSVALLDAAIDRGGERVAVLDSREELRLLSATDRPEDDASLHRRWRRVSWTPSGALVAGTDDSTSVILGCDAIDGTPDEVIGRLSAPCDALAVSLDGAEVAAGGGSVLHLTPITRQGPPRRAGPTRSLRLDDTFGGLFTVAWSPNGRKLALGSKKGNVRIIDAATGKTLRVLPGHRLGVTSLVWSSDGRMLISTDDESIRLSDTETAVAIDTFTPGWTVRSATLTGVPGAPDRWLVIGGESSGALPSADGTPGHGRLLVVDLGG